MTEQHSRYEEIVERGAKAIDMLGGEGEAAWRALTEDFKLDFRLNAQAVLDSLSPNDLLYLLSRSLDEEGRERLRQEAVKVAQRALMDGPILRNADAASARKVATNVVTATEQALRGGQGNG